MICYSRFAAGWLGLNARRFRFDLLRSGHRSSCFQRASAYDSLGKLSDPNCTPNGSEPLSDGLLYTCCIDAEMTVAELRMEEHQALFEKLVSKWKPLEIAEQVRLASHLRKVRPQAVLIFQGYEVTNWAARCEAIKLGIPLVSVENTAISDRFVFDTVSGITVNQNSSQNYFWRFKGLIPEQEHLASTKALIEQGQSKKSAEHISPQEAFEVMFKQPLILFLGQVYTDSSVLFGLGNWKSPIEILKVVVQYANKVGAKVVVKLHPKEASGAAPVTSRKYNRLTYRKISEDNYLAEEVRSQNCLIIDDSNRWNTYELMKKADVGVTVNSQAGLESSVRGVPTVVCGSSFYHGLGFTYDGSSSESLCASLDKSLNESEARRKGRTVESSEFSHIFFDKYCKPKSTKQLARLCRAEARRGFQ